MDRGLIEDSYSLFAAPVTLAFKKEEGKRSRLCIDFRDLNEIVVPEPKFFPRIEDLLVKTRDCKFFTKLDINSAFWSIPLRDEENRSYNSRGSLSMDLFAIWTEDSASNFSTHTE